MAQWRVWQGRAGLGLHRWASAASASSGADQSCQKQTTFKIKVGIFFLCILVWFFDLGLGQLEWERQSCGWRAAGGPWNGTESRDCPVSAAFALCALWGFVQPKASSQDRFFGHACMLQKPLQPLQLLLASFPLVHLSECPVRGYQDCGSAMKMISWGFCIWMLSAGLESQHLWSHNT